MAGQNSILKNEAFVAVRRRLGVEKPGWMDFVDLPRTGAGQLSDVDADCRFAGDLWRGRCAADAGAGAESAAAGDYAGGERELER